MFKSYRAVLTIIVFKKWLLPKWDFCVSCVPAWRKKRHFASAWIKSSSVCWTTASTTCDLSPNNISYFFLAPMYKKFKMLLQVFKLWRIAVFSSCWCLFTWYFWLNLEEKYLFSNHITLMDRTLDRFMFNYLPKKGVVEVI